MANVHLIKKYKNQIYTCFTKIIVKSPRYDVGIFKIQGNIRSESVIVGVWNQYQESPNSNI